MSITLLGKKYDIKTITRLELSNKGLISLP